MPQANVNNKLPTLPTLDKLDTHRNMAAMVTGAVALAVSLAFIISSHEDSFSDIYGDFDSFVAPIEAGVVYFFIGVDPRLGRQGMPVTLSRRAARGAKNLIQKLLKQPKIPLSDKEAQEEEKLVGLQKKRKVTDREPLESWSTLIGVAVGIAVAVTILVKFRDLIKDAHIPFVSELASVWIFFEEIGNFGGLFGRISRIFIKKEDDPNFISTFRCNYKLFLCAALIGMIIACTICLKQTHAILDFPQILRTVVVISRVVGGAGYVGRTLDVITGENKGRYKIVTNENLATLVGVMIGVTLALVILLSLSHVAAPLIAFALLATHKIILAKISVAFGIINTTSGFPGRLVGKQLDDVYDKKPIASVFWNHIKPKNDEEKSSHCFPFFWRKKPIAPASVILPQQLVPNP